MVLLVLSCEATVRPDSHLNVCVLLGTRVCYTYVDLTFPFREPMKEEGEAWQVRS